MYEALPLFDRTSWAYARLLQQGGGADKELKAARSERENGWNRTGEASDPWLALAFRGWEDPLEDTSAELAE